ncbi:MAG: hypothetical protein K2G77_07960, partial [Muribaculaceae bacterium]|nr:hypothetical protein [Muribaculaceae bacterium]
MNIFRKLIYLSAAVLTAILLVGCSQSDNGDDPDMPDFEEGIPTEVRITLSARSGNSQTRGDGDPKDPTSTIELIHDWWIVFINKSGEIVKIIKSTDSDVTDKKSSTSVIVPDGDDNDKGYEAQTFRTIIPSGTYRVYTFANIPPNEAIFNDPKKFQNEKHKDLYIKDFVPDAYTHNIKWDDGTQSYSNDGMQWPATYTDEDGKTIYNYIPMTQVFPIQNNDGETIVIRNTVEEAVNLEVVRSVAKVQFAFTNPSTDKITVKKLEFSPISQGDHISIVPNNSAIGKGPNDKLLVDIKETGILKFPDMNKVLMPSGGEAGLEFYCKESLGGWFDKDGKILKKEDANKNQIEHEDVFKIDLTVTKTKAGETTGTEVTKTFYTKDIKYINRNDWIYIPIKFNNWVIKWKLHYYPPIGGYPPVFNQDADGTSLQATLTTGGEFELYPVEVLMNGKSYKVDMNNADMVVSVTSGDNIFITKPQIMNNPNVSVTEHPLGDG